MSFDLLEEALAAVKSSASVCSSGRLFAGWVAVEVFKKASCSGSLWFTCELLTIAGSSDSLW